MSPNYRGLFESWEIAVAKKLVNDYRKRWKCLEREDFDDLLQECLTHWFFSKDKYDPSGGAAKNTFMARIVKNKLRDIVKEYKRNKRKVLQNSISLNQPLSEDKDDSSLLDILADESDFRVQSELKIALSETYSQLTPKQRELCAYLTEGYSSMKELGEKLGVDRVTVYREIKRIRRIFNDKGLKDFLR